MKQEQSVQAYLNRIDRLLRPLPVTERLDIVQEIRSAIAELQADGVAEAAICARLGDPQALARAYLGDCASNRKLPRCTRFLAAAGFYSVVGLTGMFVLPVLAVLTVGMLACAVIAPVAGVIEFAGGLFGFDVPFVMMQFGRWAMPFWLTLPASLVLGALFLGAAYGLWRAARVCARCEPREIHTGCGEGGIKAGIAAYKWAARQILPPIFSACPGFAALCRGPCRAGFCADFPPQGKAGCTCCEKAALYTDFRYFLR